MRRRDALLAAIGLLAVPSIRAQTERVRRIGVVRTSRSYPERYATLMDGLRALGWVEGRNLAIEWRDTDGDNARAKEAAESLVAAKVELIVANATLPVRLVRSITSTVPIVAAAVGDPVASGFAQSLARPGGNVTGVSIIYDDLNAKQVELAIALLGKLSRVASISNPDSKGAVQIAADWRAQAAKQGATMLGLSAGTLPELETALDAIGREKPDVVFLHVQPIFLTHRRLIADRLRAARVPGIGQSAEYVDAGLLASYGGDFKTAFRTAARHVDRILRGANPAELPIEQVTKIELVVNLQTARAIGVNVPAKILLQADRVIE